MPIAGREKAGVDPKTRFSNYARKPPTEEQFRDIAIQCGGLIEDIVKKLRISKTILYYWRNNGMLPFWQSAIDDGKESLLDFSESMLKQNIRKGKEASVFFHLKCQGKKRGYVEKFIIEHENNPYANMTDEELERLLAERRSGQEGTQETRKESDT